MTSFASGFYPYPNLQWASLSQRGKPQLCPSWTGVLIVVSMAATWLFAVALVRNPATRRICLKDARNISRLCWVFCALWEAALWYYDNVPKKFVMYWGATLAWALSFMIMLSFWGDLKWKRPIPMVWSLVKGGSKRVSDHLISSENNMELFAYSSLVGISFGIHEHANIAFKPQKNPDLSHLSDLRLDEKPSNFFEV
ncbi:hypothetical protein DFJ58DRAFT_885966 [Suillus subalutaceus]|uniref:uncharacterized protein n=1 Tax=Suillus subalutaceus TaxID=48586 RepID=UPI001B882FAD|nr:uncharacterized protein DFJ58DRAFT_885966 [Suillus subalutaceus]KAG1851870.1 hypothetical protein DFJ58DRAFT_885966 [Suillus subalutaceus]